MRAYCITLQGDRQSEAGFARLADSHRAMGHAFPLAPYTASTPEYAHDDLSAFGLEWTYPWEGNRQEGELRLTAYKTSHPDARVACFLSHFRLWMESIRMDEPVLVLEDDAEFVAPLDPLEVLTSGFAIIGVNDPRGATRRADVYHRAVQGQEDRVCEVPWVDGEAVPQGLAGASAYVVRPVGAAAAVALARSFGAWPNDALLCKQNAPGILGQTRRYYTRVQGTPSRLA